MKQEVHDFIRELNELSQKMNALANKPRIYNHPISHYLNIIGDKCALDAFTLIQVSNQFGLEAI